jgi:hypothetical protein
VTAYWSTPTSCFSSSSRMTATNPSVRSAVQRLLTAGDSLCDTSQNLAEFWNTCTRPAERKGYGLSIPETDRRARLVKDQFTFLEDSRAVHREWRNLLVASRPPCFRGTGARRAQFLALTPPGRPGAGPVRHLHEKQLPYFYALSPSHFGLYLHSVLYLGSAGPQCQTPVPPPTAPSGHAFACSLPRKVR